jgi:hypothetical protein
MAIPEGLIACAWVAACTILAPAALGLGLVGALGLHPSHGRRATWAFAYLVGHYALAHATALWLASGRAVPGFVLPAAAAAIGAWLSRRAAARRDDPMQRPPASWTTWLPLAVLALALLQEVLRANLEPVRISDEAQIWAAKAKVLYAAPDVDLRFGLQHLVQHADYPLFNPLVQVLAFASAGRVLHFENRLPVQFFAIALLLLLSAATTRRAHPLAAALVLVAFTGSQFVAGATTVYADVMLAMATLAAVEALLRLRETGERAWWRLACIGFAAMLSTKNEGSLLAVAVAGPFLAGWWLDRRAGRTWGPERRELWWLLLPAAAIALHRAFNSWFGLHNDLTHVGPDGLGLFGRMLHNASARGPEVLAYHFRLLINPDVHRLLPLLFGAAVAVRALTTRPRWNPPDLMLFGTVVCAIAGYALVFVGTNASLVWHMDTAAARTMQHVVAIAALGLCTAAWPQSRAAASQDRARP